MEKLLKEVELHFSDYFTVHPIEVTCHTELMNIAHQMRQEAGAMFCTFGPVIARDEDGLPDYGPRKKK